MNEKENITLINNDPVHFVIVNRSVVNDKNLTFKAKGLLAYLLDKPSRWKFSLNGICSQTKEGVNSIRNGLRELVLEGYLEVKKVKNEKNRYSGCNWIITQYPKKSEENSKKVSMSGFYNSGYCEGNSKKVSMMRFSDAGSMDAVKHDTKIYSIKEDSSLSEDNERGDEAPPAPDLKKIERSTHVHTTQEEHEKLIKDHGEEKIKWCYQELSEWKQDKPRKQWRKSDYRSILRWCIDAYEERKKKKTEVDIVEENKKLAKKAHDVFSGIAKKRSLNIIVNSDNIRIEGVTSQSPSFILPFNENGFRHQLDNILRKVKLI